jgi:hypothetical protein
MTIANAGHPPSPLKMGLPGTPCPIRLAVRIDMQDDLRDFLPICSVAVGIEKSEVGDYVLLIVNGEHIRHWGRIGDVRIKRRFTHEVVPWL